MNHADEFDFIAIGSGAGGLTAAIIVAEQGGRAIVVEKDWAIGGVTALSGGQVWIGGSHFERAAGIEDSAAETTAYLDFLSDGFARPELRDVYVTEGPKILQYLAETIGLPLRIIPDWPDYYYPTAPGSKGEGRFLEAEPFVTATLGEWASRSIAGDYQLTSDDRAAAGGSAAEQLRLAQGHRERGERCAGAALSGHLIRAALDRGVEFRVNTRATRLVRELDRVTGVEVEGPDGPAVLGARRGGLLATSSYDGNPEHVQTYEQLTGLRSATPPTVTGDHITMAGEIGGVTVSARPAPANSTLYGYAVDQGAGQPPKYALLIPGWPHTMIVNSRGERFADDSFLPALATGLGRYYGVERGYGNYPAWLIFDQQYRDTYPLGPYFPGDPLPAGLAVQRDTLEELATATGIDSSGLAATVKRFNTFCQSGVDGDFGRGSRKYSQVMTGDRSKTPNPNLGEISQSPFYAVDFLRVGVGIPTAGLKIDTTAHVVDVRGQAITGLYAAGNAAAHLDIGAGYTSGIANARGLIYGYRAATDAMK